MLELDYVTLQYTQFFNWRGCGPSTNGGIRWALGVVLWLRKASCHLGKQIDFNIMTDLLSLLRQGSHGFFPMARDPLKG